ncbi:TIGR00645 family protein [Gluconacetobacter azotocaptans]|uniref:UPF0114 protein HLH34_01625 n=1 Tax=Gluconacetobacter azotocaptans TaxID=142834 RepID=A0A7W4JPP7_9PROT|nr:TIGR00645 family protein [Gluconacetobacter azotocaptans]MBB2188664.1 TIGR00645 family protein [Gluconacetobacter azotocaptans]MBM9400426.1 TIGR00645 family protein [Gluconacetobacter azotocaptans]GBQ35174.1 hypothetical protein AA13594_3050 [Gluconacetobacter azotocaptans DSM 13594]
MTRTDGPHPQDASLRPEHVAERAFFATRWLAAPLYLGLAVGLIVIPVKFFQLAWGLLAHVFILQFDDVFVGILDLIDLVMLANLLLIVMFSGYENFVSRLDIRDHPDFPSWIGHVTFGDIKLKLMASIVAMSGIHLLADFIRVDAMTNRALAWTVGIHLAFVASGVLLSVMDRLMEPAGGHPASATDH